jgi:serine/threonine protein kinase
MTDLLKFFTGNSVAADIVAFAILLLSVIVVIIVVVAFVQGRSITFWPPSIGEKQAAAPPAQVPTPEPALTATQVLPSPAVIIGTVLEGSSGDTYKIKANFYNGSTSTIYKVLNSGGELVIAKVFWEGLTPNSTPWQLFQREQRASDILSHRNIIKTFDRGIRLGYPFTIMEYLVGGTLRDWLLGHHRLPANDLLSVAAQVADAIDYAHSLGVIHRDIKPGNILFEAGPQGRVVLSDFGIAVILADTQNRNTLVSGFRGSPAYLAPELLRGEHASRAADIYSFGVVFFEMLTGAVPFRNDQTVYSLLHTKIDTAAPDVRSIRPDVPVEISERLALTLSRDPKLRPRTARAVLAGLEAPLRQLEL